MVVVGVGVMVWLPHAVRSCTGSRSRFWLLAWLVGLPLACLLDYAVLVAFAPRPGGGIADADPAGGQLVVSLFLGLGLWMLLLVLEPLLLLVDLGARRRRAHISRAGS